MKRKKIYVHTKRKYTLLRKSETRKKLHSKMNNCCYYYYMRLDPSVFICTTILFMKFVNQKLKKTEYVTKEDEKLEMKLVDQNCSVEIELAVKSLSNTFFNDPIISYLVPNEDTRKKFNDCFFRIMVLSAKKRVYQMENFGVIMVWIRGKKENISTLSFLINGGWKIALFLEWNRILSSLQFFDDQDKKRDYYLKGAQDYYFLADIGISSHLQGKGLGSKVLSDYLTCYVDQEHLPCYLEASSESSMRLYLRHGFKLMEAFQVPPNGPMSYLMLRDAKL